LRPDYGSVPLKDQFRKQITDRYCWLRNQTRSLDFVMLRIVPSGSPAAQVSEDQIPRPVGLAWSGGADLIRVKLLHQIRRSRSLDSNLDEHLATQLGGRLASQFQEQLGDPLASQLQCHLAALLRDHAGKYYWERDPIAEELERYELNRYYVTGGRADFLEFSCAFCNKMGVLEDSLLDIWLRQSRSLHWWYPYPGIVLASDRPSELYVDTSGRFHCAEGMACRYSDGWGLYAWHGLLIPEKYFTANPTAVEILAEGNWEIRRALVERYDFLSEPG
jgi:hypothetical protein